MLFERKVVECMSMKNRGSPSGPARGFKVCLVQCVSFLTGNVAKKERDVVKCCQVHKHEKLRPQVILQTYF